MEENYTAAKLFTGNDRLEHQAITVKDGIIQSIKPASPDNQGTQLKGMVVPAFIDIQIYGAHGKLLAAYPEKDSIYKLKDYCKAGGAAHFLPTVATNPNEIIYSCIDAVRDYWQSGGEGCLGLHLEGPWISKVRKGAHVEELIHSPNIEEI
ncbi:MAG: hypothetical protein LBE56_01230, partial [Tannerella sp.]|nr:hypothetical protein [Tannerella sp.]